MTNNKQEGWTNNSTVRIARCPYCGQERATVQGHFVKHMRVVEGTMETELCPGSGGRAPTVRPDVGR